MATHPVVDKSNIKNKIAELEAERARWLQARADGSADPRLAATTLTWIEAKLRWYRGRIIEKGSTVSYAVRKQRDRRRAIRRADARHA